MLRSSNNQSGVESFIPWAKPSLAGREAEVVQEALKSNWISGGPFVEQFESELGTLLGSKFVSSCANGTGAIELAFMALGLSAGDEVVVPAYGYMAAANSAYRYGMRLKFADVDPATWCMTPESVAAVLTERTKCVIPIDTYGAVADIAGILSLCSEMGIAVLEDSAEAFGSARNGGFAGSLGTLGTLSFQATKTVSTGEGGAVLTDSETAADLVRLYRSHGVGDKKYLHLVPGMNYRMTNLQAAIGVAQLEQVGFLMSERNRLHKEYRNRLDGIPEVSFQFFERNTSPVVWATGIKLDETFSFAERDEIIKFMRDIHSVETRPGFYSPNDHTYFSQVDAPISATLSSNIIVLPGFVRMGESEIERSSNALSDAISRVKNSRGRK
jgi:perosamine synthetase